MEDGSANKLTYHDQIKIIYDAFLFNVFTLYGSNNHIRDSFTSQKYSDEANLIIQKLKENKQKEEEAWIDLLSVSMKYFRIPNLMPNMIISSLISFFDYFLKSSLMCFLLHEPRALKPSKRQITFEEVLNYNNYDELFLFMVEKELDDEFRKNIEGIKIYIINRYQIDLENISNYKLPADIFSQSKYTDKERIEFQSFLESKRQSISWDSLREIYYRRNLIVHNDGKINQDYINNFKADNGNGYLLTDNNYVNNSFFIFIYYANFFYEKMISKINIK